MMYTFGLVALGGAAGSVLRYAMQRAFNFGFPYGTLAVNITGCLLVGIFWGLAAKGLDEQRRLLAVTGFCGGFTTFSSFSHEAVQMLIEDRWLTFALYTGASVVAGLLATYLGFKLTH